LNNQIKAGSETWQQSATLDFEPDKTYGNITPTSSSLKTIVEEASKGRGFTGRPKEMGKIGARRHPLYDTFRATLALVTEMETYFRLMTGRYATLGALGIVGPGSKQAATRKEPSQLIGMLDGRLSGRYGTLAEALTGSPDNALPQEYHGIEAYGKIERLYKSINNQLGQAATVGAVEQHMTAKGATTGNGVTAQSLTPAEIAEQRRGPPRPK